MILAAGRGERMRPLSEATPKPLLVAGGRPLIVWQIEGLARAGFRTLVINVSHLAEQITAALGDGGAYGVRIRWSPEAEPLEPAGGIATAMPLIPEGPVLIEYHPGGDFALEGSRIHWDGPNRLTYGSIGVYDSALFRELPRHRKIKLLPLLHEWISRGLVSGERYVGPWANVGTPAELATLDQQLSDRVRPL
jgi:N-acetyl-alpha-D-muramate 1-phosphate uridylyltransferase